MRCGSLSLTVVTTTWLALIVAAPVAASGVMVSAATYALGSVVCHQREDRSFQLESAQLPVCARCTGLYAGAVAGAVASLTAYRRRSLSYRVARIVLAGAAVPTVLLWGAEFLEVADISNTTRAVAAWPLGAAIVAAVAATMDGRLR